MECAMFKGSMTALVTPFRNNAVDEAAFQKFVDWQIKEGIDGIVPVGTTGESPTLDFSEHKLVIETAIKAAAGRIKVIAGTGANSTSEAVELTRFAAGAGADGSLQVTPYYNKPTQEGLYRHFSMVADIGLPIVLYNIPGRCGLEIALETVFRLARHPKIAAVKEAAGSVTRVSRIAGGCDLTVLSGDDPLTLPMMIAGASGVISVAANVAPDAVAGMVHHALAGRWAEAAALHRKYFSLFEAMFLETNPIPIKAAMAMRGLIEETYRMPLCEMTPGNREKLAKTLQETLRP